jgi:AcrR family transcriptional regulator
MARARAKIRNLASLKRQAARGVPVRALAAKAGVSPPTMRRHLFVFKS